MSVTLERPPRPLRPTGGGERDRLAGVCYLFGLQYDVSASFIL
jgi:hypothetical protein